MKGVGDERERELNYKIKREIHAKSDILEKFLLLLALYLGESSLVAFLRESSHDDPNMQMKEEEVGEVSVRDFEVVEEFVELH